MNTCVLKQKQSKLVVNCVTTLMVLGLTGFAGSASAACGTDWSWGLFPTTYSSCDRTRVTEAYYPTTYHTHHRHHCVHHHGNYWTNWQPVYYAGKVRCKESCLVSRGTGKVVRCVKQCSNYCCGGYGY